MVHHFGGLSEFLTSAAACCWLSIAAKPVFYEAYTAQHKVHNKRVKRRKFGRCCEPATSPPCSVCVVAMEGYAEVYVAQMEALYNYEIPVIRQLQMA